MSSQHDPTVHDTSARESVRGDAPYDDAPYGPTGVVVATFGDYLSAQAAVDLLSDKKFDVSGVQIVGHGLHSVESVRGRMTKGRASLYGAGAGVWFGLLIGLLLGLFLPNPLWFNFILGGLILGAIWGLIFGFIGHLATGGRRDFTSVKGIEATRYDLVVASGLADEAIRVLAAGR